jgi:lysophospholipase L1-like esterase
MNARFLLLLLAAPLVGGAAPIKFVFGTSAAPAGANAVRSDSVFSQSNGFGFEPGAAVTAGADGVVGSAPFYFSAHLPAEGNYRVTVTFPGGTDATVKAELRRLMIEHVQVPARSTAKRAFTVNTRTPKIAAVGDIREGIVKLKAPRESVQEAWAWDDALTLEFAGAHPAVSAIEIEPVNVPTIFLIGDSTVCDQSKEPFNSWGQMFPRWFKPDIAIANHAESGETYRDSIGRRRLDKMLSAMKPGDWLIMQFGHNDQKQIAAGTGGPFTTYKDEIKKHVDAVRAHGGTPIIVSPMERRNFDEHARIKPSLTDYAEASRQAAKELGVAFIDLNAMSIPFYEALEARSPDFSRHAFAGQDNTHHQNFGSYELAKCIVQSIRNQKLPLAKFVVDEFSSFDPAHPDDVEKFAVPASPNFTNQRPLGDEPAASPAAATPAK